MSDSISGFARHMRTQAEHTTDQAHKIVPTIQTSVLTYGALQIQTNTYLLTFQHGLLCTLCLVTLA